MITCNSYILPELQKIIILYYNNYITLFITSFEKTGNFKQLSLLKFLIFFKLHELATVHQLGVHNMFLCGHLSPHLSNIQFITTIWDTL